MKVKIVIILLSLFQLSFSQKLEFYFGSGINNSSQDELKSLEESWLKVIEVPAKITDNFPSTPSYSGIVKLRFKWFYVGYQYSFTSTGSRISYSDYSGNLTYDFICSSHKFGPSVTFNIAKKNHIYLNLYSHFPIILSKVTIKEVFEIYTEKQENKTNFSSMSFGYNPGVELIYKFSRYNIGSRVSYLIDSKGIIYRSNNSDNYLLNFDDQKVHTNWSGYQIEILFGVNLYKE